MLFIFMNRELCKLNSNSKKAFGVLEIIISVGIIGIVGMSLVQMGIVALVMSQRSGDQTQAVFLLQEASEAVRFLKDESWIGNVESLSTGTNYYLIWDGNDYSLSTTESPPIYGKFKRTVELFDVLRDDQDDINATGTLDPLSKKVVVEISWPYKGGVATNQVEFYIMNILDN